MTLKIVDERTEDPIAELGGNPRRDPEAMRRWLETEIWPLVPQHLFDRPPMTKAEREEILGFGPDGA